MPSPDEAAGSPNLGFYIGIVVALIVFGVGAAVWISVHGV